jgi:hypothetical protein
MRPLEVAIIEALKAGDAVIEAEWPAVVRRVRELIEGGHVRLEVLRHAARLEHDLTVRQQFAAIDLELTGADGNVDDVDEAQAFEVSVLFASPDTR